MSTPLVLIVGRPNVGKSTLFNRLTKSDDAIVDDFSGVTRDRLYGEVEWNGKTFRLMDTGGYVPESDDLFEKAIREQVEFAIEEVDAIMFVADGRHGVNPYDAEVARILRTSKKPVFLLVNKLDTPQQSMHIAEFYTLGIKEVFDVSALNGRNLGDLLDEVVTALEIENDEEDDDNRLRISIIGKPNVGKSSLTNALLGYDRTIVTNIPGTTRDSIDSVLKYYGEEIVLVDTAGLRRKSKVQENIEFYSNVRTFRALMDSDVAILVIDAETGVEKQDQKIVQEAIRRRKGLIIAVNKWDLIEKETNTAKQYADEIIQTLGSVYYVPIIFISALTKQRIFRVIDLAKKVYAERGKKISTSKLNDVLLPEIQKNPPPATPTGREIKIKYITQGGQHYPIFIFFCNYPKHIHDSYKRFLERKIRENFGFEGVAMTLSFKDKS
jgi:GTP-binding protein